VQQQELRWAVSLADSGVETNGSNMQPRSNRPNPRFPKRRPDINVRWLLV
jgi:hypothetical protein